MSSANELISLLNTKYAHVWATAPDTGTTINMSLPDFTSKWLEGLAVDSVTYLVGSQPCASGIILAVCVYEVTIPT